MIFCFLTTSIKCLSYRSTSAHCRKRKFLVFSVVGTLYFTSIVLLFHVMFFFYEYLESNLKNIWVCFGAKIRHIVLFSLVLSVFQSSKSVLAALLEGESLLHREWSF